MSKEQIRDLYGGRASGYDFSVNLYYLNRLPGNPIPQGEEDKGADLRQIEASLKERVKRAAELTPKVEFVELSEIFHPGQTLKATRVIDERPQE